MYDFTYLIPRSQNSNLYCRTVKYIPRNGRQRSLYSAYNTGKAYLITPLFHRGVYSEMKCEKQIFPPSEQRFLRVFCTNSEMEWIEQINKGIFSFQFWKMLWILLCSFFKLCFVEFLQWDYISIKAQFLRLWVLVHVSSIFVNPSAPQGSNYLVRKSFFSRFFF